MKFYNYLIGRGGKVELKAIEQPTIDFGTPLKAFTAAFKHEQVISKSINELMDIAIKENDHACKSFLQWYVDEQVEEEANAEKVLNKLKMIGDNSYGILMLDTELGTRVFTPPVTGV